MTNANFFCTDGSFVWGFIYEKEYRAFLNSQWAKDFGCYSMERDDALNWLNTHKHGTTATDKNGSCEKSWIAFPF